MFRPKISQRGSYRIAEAVLCRGPQAVGDSTNGLLERNWCLVLDRDDLLLHLYQETLPLGSGNWVEKPLEAIPHAGNTLRHISLTFDQAAIPIVAYERSDGCYVRQWNPISSEYVMRGPFAGVDPLLLMDVQVTNQVAGSDVLLFYLSPSRTQIHWRKQAENFAVEHSLADTLEAPVEFAEPVYMDQVVAMGGRYELALQLSSGSKQYWLSELYPIYLPPEQVGIAGQTRDGLYAPTVFRHEHGESLGVEGAPRDGNYMAAVLFYTATDLIGVQGAPRDGAYAPARLEVTVGESILIAGAPIDLFYALGAIRYEFSEAALTVAGAPRDGAYYL